jgi:ribosomal protein S12 methylthiotransferase accessory factor
MDVAVWNATTDTDVASFMCRLQEARGNVRSALGVFWGAGCHLSRDIALMRAITEAVQSRLTYIAGSRDDLHRRDYSGRSDASLFDVVRDAWEMRNAGCRFRDVPDCAGPTLEDDLATLLARLRSAGIEQVAAVDLTDDRFGIPVVRIVIPGLESLDVHARVRPGRRARAFIKPVP